MELYSSKPILLIIGGSSTAVEIKELVESYYQGTYSAVYNVVGDNDVSSLNNIVRDSDLVPFLEDNTNVVFIIGFSNSILRKKFRDIFAKYNVLDVNIIHPTALISPTACLGKGIYLAGNAVISSNVRLLGSSLINFNVTIGHDCIIGEECCINPGARISGNVTIGNNVLIGANSCIYQGVSIGNDCLVDAMTYVHQNIDNSKMCTNRMGGLKIYKKNL